MKKAFTLIELLVVIAIIAILAAILFPVFAQAKAAAKATASISNAKQITLGSLMYSGDSDDTFMPVNGYSDGNFVGYYTWVWSEYPYIKSADLFRDPSGPSITTKAGRKYINQVTLTPHYGYNYAVLSPFTGADPGTDVPHPISQSVLGAPSDTVAFASKFDNASESNLGTDNGYSYGNIGPDTWGIVDQPDCAHSPAWCFDNWGVGSFWGDPTYVGIKTFEAGKLTGGVSFRVSGKATVAFADGSVRKMSPGALAAGTNWSMTAPSTSIVVNDESKYLWDNK